MKNTGCEINEIKKINQKIKDIKFYQKKIKKKYQTLI